MIKKLEIDNFKSIKHLQIECSDINLLIGINSSGKSSVIQGLLFFAQNMDEPVGLNGALAVLGTMEENKCVFSKNKEITVGIVNDQERELKVKLFYEEEKLQLHRSCAVDDSILQEYSVEKRNVQYLSCHRIGPQNAYKKNLALNELIGIEGEFALAYLDGHGGDPLADELCKENQDYTLSGQVNWWLSYIAGAQVSTEAITGTNLIKVSYAVGELSNLSSESVGSGISYLISVLIMCLSSPEKSVLVIENPEIHLHPSAQAKVCEFLYFIAQSGRQLFIESHSDHIFNGFRAGIATGEMDKEKINIQFVSLNEEHLTKTMRVEIGRMGRIENQRKDLFDQFDLYLKKMIGVRGNDGSYCK